MLQVNYDIQKTRLPNLPIEHDTCWHNDQVRAPVSALNCEVSQERDGLDGLSKTHFIGLSSELSRHIETEGQAVQTKMPFNLRLYMFASQSIPTC